MRAVVTAIGFVLGIATSSSAQDQSELNRLSRECLEAVEAGQMPEAKAIAVTFAEFEGMHVFDPAQRQGARCLNATTDTEWIFDPTQKRFLPQDVFDAIRQMAQIERQIEIDKQRAVDESSALIRKAKEQRAATENLVAEANEAYRLAFRQRVNAQTLVACNALYGRDQHAALLSPVCHPLFVANGLPDD